MARQMIPRNARLAMMSEMKVVIEKDRLRDRPEAQIPGAFVGIAQAPYGTSAVRFWPVSGTSALGRSKQTRTRACVKRRMDRTHPVKVWKAQRNDANAARISTANSNGCSQAAK